MKKVITKSYFKILFLICTFKILSIISEFILKMERNHIYLVYDILLRIAL